MNDTPPNGRPPTCHNDGEITVSNVKPRFSTASRVDLGSCCGATPDGGMPFFDGKSTFHEKGERQLRASCLGSLSSCQPHTVNKLRSDQVASGPVGYSEEACPAALGGPVSLDAAVAFMEAIEANRATSKRLKIEGRLRPRAYNREEEFESEWQALPNPKDGEYFAVQASALPFGNSIYFTPYFRSGRDGEPDQRWASTNYDAIEACLRPPRKPPRDVEAPRDQRSHHEQISRHFAEATDDTLL